MELRPAIDVSSLPATVFGYREPLWWAVIGLIAIEGTVFAILIACYFYLRLQSASWPPYGWAEPSLLSGTANLLVILLGTIVMRVVDRNAPRGNERLCKQMVLIFFVLCAAMNAIRIFEFRDMHVKWDSNAYGSIVWLILGMHTLHLGTSLLELMVIGTYLFLRGMDPKHALDLQLTAVYWYFVAGSWAVLYPVLYFGPRMLN